VSASSLDQFDVCAGPPARVERWIGLTKPGHQRTRFRAALVVLVGWVPLVILAAFRDIAQHGNSVHSLFTDAGNYARYLIAAPLCIAAAPFCSPRFKRIILHFRNSGIVRVADSERYERIVASSNRLLKSTVAEIIIFAMAYCTAAIFIGYVPRQLLPEWQVIRDNSGLMLSPAGQWHAIVSLPLLMVLLIAWAWRHILWMRFLWSVSLLDLNVIPSHPDRCCGLKFLSTSIRGYALLVVACSSIVAGGIATRMIVDGTSPEAYYRYIVVVVLLLVVLFIAPLGIFIPVLRRVQASAMFEYGALARNIGSQFEHKWIPRQDNVDPNDLEVPDFSATTDLYSVAANAYSIGYLPLSLRTLEELIFLSALPFVPLILATVPVSTIFQNIAKFLV
jgi:hypothetical protein